MRKLPIASERDSSDVTCREGAGLSPKDVWTELERIFSSTHFQASERRRAFLRFIVDETLSGRADSLKGFTIALAVFGRDDSFDPQADPVVRLEARRLRRDLDSYYMDAGQNDAVRISIPKGSYVPNFEWHGAPPATSTSHQASEIRDRSTHDVAGNGRSASKPGFLRHFPIVAAFVVGLAIGVLGWILLSGRTRPHLSSSRDPAVLVMPFEVLSPGEGTRYFAIGIGQELVGNLFRFAGFRLYTFPFGSDQDSSLAAVQLARKLGVTYVINGSVQTNTDEVRVTTRVVNATNGEVVWTKTYARPSNSQSLMGVQADLADEIATVIGQPYGVVKSDLGNSPSPPAVSNMESYACVLRAYGYRRNFSRTEFDPVLRCLEQTVRRDPGYSDGWAMLGWLHVDAGRLGYTGDGNRQKEYEKALEATAHAVTLQPNNPLALKALGAAYYYVGRYEESERVTRQAVALNPNDPEVLAQLGWRLAARGNFEEGIPILKRAIERSLNPPSWYFHLIAIDLYLKGNYPQMRAVAERSQLGDAGFSQLLLAVANDELGNRDAARQALEKMSQYEPVARDPEGFLRRHGATDQIVDALMTGLRKAQSIASK
ncbi:tetratricopeptide repeat protein [Bradyrhizobium sp. I1.14.4]|uniref:tetratricopeptide repeat protein n=1 Tax=unclassified Bradyrhizobium TaxID=2631580 RepID=UPI003D1EAE57